MATFVLRGMDDGFWARVKNRVKSEGRGLRETVLHVLDLYAEVGMSALEQARANVPPKKGSK